MPTAAIHMGDGHVVHSCGDFEVDLPMGSKSIVHRFHLMDTETFDFVLGTNFFADHPHILSLTLQAPYVLHVDHGHGGECCKVFVQPIFSLFSVQNPDICTPTENHDPSTVLDSVGISGSGISVVLHSWCFHHFLYNKTQCRSATASPEIARADPEIVDF